MTPEPPERWASVAGWPQYSISSLGRVKRGEMVIKTFPVKGYHSFNVSQVNGLRKSLRVHRQMAIAFLGDNPGLLVRHLDGDAANNKISNLAWGTPSDNESDKRNHGRAMDGETHHQAKLKVADVLAIRSSDRRGVELASQFNVNPSTICAIRKRRSWNRAK